MFKTLSAATLAAAAAFIPTTAAAGVITSGNIAGYSIDYINESANRFTPDHIVLYGPAGRESIQVTCTNSYSGMSWNSYGPNSRSWVNHIATEWCF